MNFIYHADLVQVCKTAERVQERKGYNLLKGLSSTVHLYINSRVVFPRPYKCSQIDKEVHGGLKKMSPIIS